jgi:hypothetical protein
MKNKKIRKPLLFKEGLGWLILGCCAILICGTVALGSIDNNNWGGINPYTAIPLPATASFSVIYPTATFSATPPPGTIEPSSVMATWRDSSGSFSCSGYPASQRIISKGAKPFSVPPWTDTCAHFKSWGAFIAQNQADAQMQYDSLHIYIEKCAVSDNTSWRAFGKIDAANQFRSDDSNRYPQYRAWLISVLYLNTIQPAYFCSCLGSIANTYQKANEFLSVWNYMRHNQPECWSTGMDIQYSQDSASAAHRGEDPTHLIPLDSLGLGFLLKGAVTPITGSSFPSEYITSFTSSPNPFNNATALQFTLSRVTYTTIGIYDELGRLVWGDGRGASLEAGEHTIQLDATNFPSGTLYARISTGFGEVKTVKLVHEK